jgi:ferredoxin-NADP reductase
MARAAVRERLTWQDAKVGAVVRETAQAVTIVLEVADWPGHRAGQHLDIRLTAEDGYQAERSYSIASAPGEPLAITVERLDDGEVSPYLTEELRAGDELELRGPIGGYFVWDAGDDPGPLLLAAGGSGIVPLRAILRHRERTGAAVPARLLYSARSLPDVIYREELDHYKDVRVVYTLTRVRPPGWTGPARRVDAALLADVAWPSGQDPLAFVCGPTSFVEAVAEGLVGLGYPQARVKTERFGATGGS